MTYEQTLSRASGHFLSRQLPVDWHKWELSRVDKFIKKWRCELVEDQPVQLVYEYIETLAIDMLRFVEEQNKTTDE